MPIKRKPFDPYAPKPTPKPPTKSPAKQAKKKGAAKKAKVTYRPAPGTTSERLYSIYSSRSDIVVAVGGDSDGVIVRAQKNKDGWEKTLTKVPGLRGINGISWDVMFAVGDGAILFSDDLGETWEESKSDFDECAYRSWLSSDDEDTWVCADDGVLFYSKDNGGVWEQKQLDTSARVVSFFGLSSEVLFAGTEAGEIFQSTDTGETWSLAKCDVGQSINRIFGDKKELYAVSDGGYFLRSLDQGKTWQHEKPTDAGNLEGGACSPKDKTLYAVGSKGTILVQSPKQPWRKIPAPTSGTIWDVSVSDDGVAYLCADGGKLWMLTAGGTFSEI